MKATKNKIKRANIKDFLNKYNASKNKTTNDEASGDLNAILRHVDLGRISDPFTQMKEEILYQRQKLLALIN